MSEEVAQVEVPASLRASAEDLLGGGLDMAFQPIVHLGSAAVIAYEALARPRHPAAGSPPEFFDALGEAGLRMEGERAAFAAAIARFGRGDGPGTSRLPHVKLFLNASPTTLVDPTFDVLEFLELAQSFGLAPNDLVIEVTESEAIHDLATLARRGRRLRRLGVGLAVDDAGAGHASFRVITRLRPSYIKIDRDLVTGVDSDGARHAFIGAMVGFSRQIGSRLIAEGIETVGELASLATLGVEAGQGYYIARPSLKDCPRPSDGARRLLARSAQRLRLGAARVTAEELARPPAVISRDTTVREAYSRFVADPALTMLVVTDPGDSRQHLVAQVTRRTLEHALSAPGTWERMGDRSVLDIADSQAVTIPASLNVIDVGAILAARPSHEIGEDVVVTDLRGGLLGVAPVRDIIRALSDVRRFGVQDLHPLTGLRGPSWAEDELDRRVRFGDPVTVIFVDVDGFRGLNDVGGYAFGDDVLRALGRCLTGVAGGVETAQAAHLGADDFLLIVGARNYEELVSEVVRSFESEVLPFMRAELRLRGADHLCAGAGLSMGAVDLWGGPPPGQRPLEWALDRLSGLVFTAREQSGYSCVHHSGDILCSSTWTPRTTAFRTISLGLSEPSVVLRALELIDRAWEHWWANTDDDATGASEPLASFPGPQELVDDLRARHLDPLRKAAYHTLEARIAVMEVVLSGPEAELLELLDRVALVTNQAYGARRLPIPPELALLDRLLRQRSRAITRQDRMTRVVVEGPPGLGLPPGSDPAGLLPDLVN